MSDRTRKKRREPYAGVVCITLAKILEGMGRRWVGSADPPTPVDVARTILDLASSVGCESKDGDTVCLARTGGVYVETDSAGFGYYVGVHVDFEFPMSDEDLQELRKWLKEQERQDEGGGYGGQD